MEIRETNKEVEIFPDLDQNDQDRVETDVVDDIQELGVDDVQEEGTEKEDDEPDDDDDDDLDDDDEREIINDSFAYEGVLAPETMEVINTGTDILAKGLNCCRYPMKFYDDLKPENYEYDFSISYNILSTINLFENVECLSNEIINCCNLVSFSMINNFSREDYNYAFLDLYLRKRHDILHDYSLKCIGINVLGSDIKFCNILPIMSERTPDYISVDENKILIIETTVTTDKGKSYMMKGRIESGYKSKYEKEISELQDLGYQCNYLVFVFDVKDYSDKSYQKDIETAASYLNVEIDISILNDLEYMRCTFSELHRAYGKLYSTYFSGLFSNDFTPKKTPNEMIDYMFMPDDGKPKLHYGLVTVSNNVYKRVQNSWIRIKNLFDKLDISDSRFMLQLDVITNKFSTKEVKVGGLTQEEWENCLNYEDKINLFNNLETTVDGIVVPDTGRSVEFFIPTKTLQHNRDILLLEVKIHDSSVHSSEMAIIPDYKELVVKSIFTNKVSKFEDNNYEEKLSQKICEFMVKMDTEKKFDNNEFMFKNKVPFSYNTITDVKIKSAVSSFNKAYEEKNDFTKMSRGMLWQKPSYSYPLVNMMSGNYCSYKEKPIEILDFLASKDLGNYTNLLIRKFMDNDFVFGSEIKESPKEINELEVEISDLQRRMHKLQMSNKTVDHKFKTLNDIEGGKELTVLYKDKRFQLKKLSRELGYNRSMLSVVRLPTRNSKKMNGLGASFQDEMKHYKNKREKSTYKGVGLFDYEQLESEFSRTKINLLSPCGKECPDKLLDEFVGEDVTLLKNLKSDCIDDKKSFLKFLMGTNIYHSAALVSRFCYTLLYFSQTSIGSDYVLGDNLGTDSVLLICKGGKKVFRTKKSKLFRIFFKTYNCSINDYSRPGFESNFKCFDKDGSTIVCSPWMAIDEVLLTDGLTFLSRSMGFCLMNVTKRVDNLEIISENYFNIILALHGRRKTEELLHNMRYLTVNCMSEISSIDKMLPTIADFNYDFFQCYIRGSISNNYAEFGISLKKYHDSFKVKGQTDLLLKANINHIFDRSVKIKTLETLTMVIYCTFLMSKAPVTQSLEQVKNLKNMLDTHDLHEDCRPSDYMLQYEKTTVTIEESVSLEDYWSQLFKNDFIYDPKYTTLVGNFASDYLLTRKTKSEFSSKWNQIISNNWDSMANTAGLRGDKGPDFFGKKGYYVVYNEVLKDKSKLNDILEVMNSEMDDFSKRKYVNKLNEDYGNKINNLDYPEAVFHVVDKRQRGGSREIFVMDYKTKINQQPIEKFMAFLCKMVPNELISIPSNKRLFHIHSNVFEKFNDNTNEVYNIVLDCRRWAPHSVINKFIDFLIGMRECLPNGFLIHCLNFFEVMFKKKVYTRKYVFDIMKNNEGISDKLKSYLVEDDEVQGYYLEMSYSWMMGIFNYLSSLLHVFNQMHMSQMIMRCSIKTYNKDLNIHMNAHSDDSGGKIACSNRLELRVAFVVYELFLKSCNHMLSDKKCTISKTYFELLSILYIGNRLLSLLTKFAGSFTFHPSDNGYSIDVLDAYSKSIELMVNGADFSQCYLSMKIMSYMIWRFYFGNDVPKKSYDLPPQLLGMPDSHPINIMLSGGDADLVRLQMNEDSKRSKIGIEDFVYISKYFGNFDNLEDSFLVPIKCEPQIIMSKKLRDLSELSSSLAEDYAWLVNNVELRNTAISLLKYLNKLKDRKFNAALQDETLIRRVSRAYYYRSSRSVTTTKGRFSYRQIRDILQLYLISSEGIQITGDWSEELLEVRNSLIEYKLSEPQNKSYFELLNSEVIALNRSFEELGYRDRDIVKSVKTCKPVHVNVQRVNTPITQDFSPQNLTSWICFTNTRWLLPHSGYNDQEKMIENFFVSRGLEVPRNQPNWIYRFLSKYKSKYLKEYYMHSNMPTGMRDINTFKDVLTLIAHNSVSDRYIEGLVVPYGRTITMPTEQMFGEFMTNELIDMMNLTDLVSGIVDKPKILEIFKKMKVNYKDKMFNVFDFLEERINEMSNELSISNMLKPHIDLLISHIKGADRLDANLLKQTYYHCFLKRQHLVGNVWLGRGSLFINTPNFSIKIEIENQNIKSVTLSNNTVELNRHEITYIDYVLQNAQLPNLKSHVKPVEIKDWMRRSFGLNDKGYYCIAEGRHLVASIRETYVQKNMSWVQDSLKYCDIKILPRMKYSIEQISTIEENRKIIIHTFDLPVRAVLKTARKYFENSENYSIANKSGIELKEYLNDLVGEATESERRIQKEDFLNNYTLSKTYSMLKHLGDSGRLNLRKIVYREKIFPGQETGFLDMLMKYKDLDKKFLFNYERVITPELLYLKSSQPDAFISSLVTNLKDKYYSMYNSNDRAEIMKSMRKIVEQMGSSDDDKVLIQTLSSWGYIGVMGALGELKAEQNIESFKMFRYVDGNINNCNFSMLLLKNLLKCLIDSYGAIQNTNIIIDNVKLPATKKHFSMLLLSYLHSNAISCYTKTYIYNDYNLSMGAMVLQELFTALFQITEYKNTLVESLSNFPLLSNVVIHKDHVGEFMIALKTLINNICSCNVQGEFINNNNKILRSNVVQQCTKITEILACGEIKFDVKNLIHNGTISDEFYKQHLGIWTIEVNNKPFTIELTAAENFRVLRMQFNCQYIIPRPLKYFDDDDEENADMVNDIVSEFDTFEPDIDTIDDTLSSNLMLSPQPRKTMVKYKGRVIQTDYIRAKLINVIGCYSTNHYEERLANQSETIVILSDFVISGLTNTENPNVGIFRFLNESWIGKSLIDKSWIIIYVKDSKPINHDLWEKYLGAERMNWASFALRSSKVTFSKHYNEDGVFIDMNSMKSNFNYLMEYYDRVEDSKSGALDTIDDVEEEEKIVTLLDELKEIGLDSDTIDRHREHLMYINKFEFEQKNDFLKNMIDVLMKEKETINLIKSKVSDVLSKKREKQFLERVFELPGVFALGTPSMSNIKNRALKDVRVRSEIESIANGLTNLILSNRLTISERKLKLMRSQIKLCRVYAKVNRNKVKNKNFLIDFATLVLNDADMVVDSDNDDIWDQIIETMSEFITLDEEDVETSDSDSYNDKPDVGVLHYDVI